MVMEIIYQDQDIIVINKPAGISVHGGPTIRGKTLVDFLLANFPEIKNVGEYTEKESEEKKLPYRPGIVHRLDKDTSGVMVVARNQKSFGELKKIFQERKAEKKYLALVCGAPKNKRGLISEPIGRMAQNPAKRGVASDRIKIKGAREAITEYKVKKEFNGYALVEFSPKTGRMHQIRVHAKTIGHPIACDKTYGGKNVCCPGGLKRMFLHAQSLSFSFPEGKRVSFEADLPEDLAETLKSLH
jgi:23S rRNA pseudouridine1911/1915/1917 synthase